MKDQAVQASQLVRLADLDGIGTGLGECVGVGGIVALNGQDADFGEFLFGQWSSWESVFSPRLFALAFRVFHTLKDTRCRRSSFLQVVRPVSSLFCEFHKNGST